MPTTRDLFFWLPKLLDFVEQPFDWVLLLLLVSLVLFWRGRDRAGRRTVLAASLLLASLGWTAIPEMILQRLENAYPPTLRSLTEFEGVVVLGGGVEGGRKAMERGQTSLGGSAERVTAAMALARTAPNLKIVLTGYAGVNESAGLTEADATVRFFQEQGLDTSRVIVEPASRNTSEIAQNTKVLPGVNPSQRWLLLTSAWNMPRALLSFRAAGWNVEPMPVDYVTGASVQYFRYSVAGGAARWSIALHELLGISWYRMTGRL